MTTGASRSRGTGSRVAGTGRAGFTTLIREETARWAAVVRSTGFKAIE